MTICLSQIWTWHALASCVASVAVFSAKTASVWRWKGVHVTSVANSVRKLEQKSYLTLVETFTSMRSVSAVLSSQCNIWSSNLTKSTNSWMMTQCSPISILVELKVHQGEIICKWTNRTKNRWEHQMRDMDWSRTGSRQIKMSSKEWASWRLRRLNLMEDAVVVTA